ncbi:MAG TPA: TSUP family transporter [Candidatus Dormibacteraeota bacterium]|nr:TSUP family transporter [Candidatus Dormibacteraeota bacterium]
MGPLTLLFLAGAGFCGGLVDSVVGGGGVITLPALLLAGVPVPLSLGTNKLAGTAASSTATAVFARAARVDPRFQLRVAPAVLLAGAVGALAASRIDAAALRLLIVAAVLAAAVWAALRPPPADGPRRPHGRLAFAAGAAGCVLVGFYDGLLGPGTGLFLFAVLTGPLGFTMLDGAGNGRALNLASNAGALAVFALLGRVNVLFGLAMAAGVVLGARTGATLTLSRGAAVVRPMLLVAGILLAGRLLLPAFGH